MKYKIESLYDIERLSTGIYINEIYDNGESGCGFRLIIEDKDIKGFIQELSFLLQKLKK